LREFQIATVPFVPGTYNIQLTIGDREMGEDAIIREDMRIYVNGFYIDTVSTMPGQIINLGFQVQTDVSQLRISLKDQSGRSSRAVLNGMTIEMVSPGTEAPETTVVQNDDSLIVITHGYTLPEGIGTVLDTIEVTAQYITHRVEQAIEVLISASKAYVKGFVLSGGNPVAAKIAAVKAAKLKVMEQMLQDIKWILQQDFTSVRAKSPVHDWVFDMVDQLALMSDKFRLGTLDTNAIPVDLSDAYASIVRDNATTDQILSHWKGSQDFLVLDWTRESNDGLGLLEFLDANPAEEAYRHGVNSAATVYEGLIRARVAKLKEDDPNAKLDLLLISHGFGYNVNRELVERLAVSDIATDLDYVKFQSLDPISMNPDELLGTSLESDRYYWYHPEFNAIVDQVENIYQTEGFFKLQGLLDPGSILSQSITVLGVTPAAPLVAAIRGSMLLVSRLVKDNAEQIADALTFGRPLDGREGGGNAGFYNGQARVFDLSTSNELLRFRHWDTDAVNLEKGRLATELTDIEFSPDGKYIVSSGEDGIVTVRYAQDVPDPSTGGATLLHSAGQPVYTIWGQDSWVRSIDFIEIEVEPGVRKYFILTLSSPEVSNSSDPDYHDIDRNKLLLTDLETGEAVWQGKDVGGTHVSASPSGNVIVTTDRNGNANVWRRNPELITTFDKTESVVAHPGGGGSRILDVIAVNDEYFITASVDETVRVFQVKDDEIIRRGLPYVFADVVQNLAYDPFNGLLAVGAGAEISFYTFDQGTGTLLLELRRPNDHVKTVQGLAFTKPNFMLDANGVYQGLHSLPESLFRAEGDLDRNALNTFLSQQSPSRNSLDGLKLVSGGEDRTLFLWNLSKQNWDIKNPIKESVLSGAMLPIREVAITADGNRVAVVGQNNIDDSDGYTGGPVRDINATSAIDKRIGFHWSELFIGGVREHADVPYYYTEEIVQVAGEEWFWQRDNDALSRPGDLPPENNFAIPPNKRDGKPGMDYVEVNAQVRPGKQVKLQPLKYLLEFDRDHYSVVQVLSQSMTGSGTSNVLDAKNRTIGTIRRSNADSSILVFEAATSLDFEIETKYSANIPVTIRRAKGDTGAFEDITFNIMVTVRNNTPVTQKDLVEIYPERTRDIRPLNNDYDFEGDAFRLNGFQDQDLKFRNEKVGEIFRVPGVPGLVRVKATLTEAQFSALIAAAKAENPNAPDFMEIFTTYDVKEDDFIARSSGQIVTRIQLQEAPENLTVTELGADQFRLNWDPVGWTATKYVIERYDAVTQQWVTHTDTNDGDQESKLITGVTKTTAYVFRVVAKNTNNGRTVESSPIPVNTPDYEAPRSVVPGNPAGATFIDVRWEKVYWDAGAYVVRLQKMRVDANGNPVLVNGELQFDDFREVPIGANENANHRFKNLDPGTTYLVSVYARRDRDNTQSPVRYAEAPTTTPMREVPSAVAAERVGPEKIKVTWTGVSWNVQEYRVVVLDARTGDQVKKAKAGKNDTTLIVDDKILPEKDYVIFVDALDSKGNWISVLPEDGINVTRITNISPVIVLTGGVQSFVFDSELSGDVSIPSVAGQDYGANFSLLNLSTRVTRLVPPVGERLFDVDSAQFVDAITLQPALPNHSAETVSYSVTLLDQGVWEVKHTLDARVVTTPTYSDTPVEPGSFQYEATTSSITVKWASPLWRVQSYRLKLLNGNQEVRNRVVDSKLNADGVPRMDADYEEVFNGLEPGISYSFELTARGNTSARTGVLNEHIPTLGLYSPGDLDAESIRLRSFVATWNSVDWGDLEPTGYRVLVELKNGANWDAVSIWPTGKNATSVNVVGLLPASEYRFTIEAKHGSDSWITNTNWKTVKTLAFELPDNVFLQSPGNGPKRIELDWSNVFTTAITGGFSFGADAIRVNWRKFGTTNEPNSETLAGTVRGFTITGLTRGEDYEIWIDFSATGVNNPIILRTQNNAPLSTAPATPPTGISFSDVMRGSFRISWTLPAGNSHDWYNATVSLNNGATWRNTERSNGGSGNGIDRDVTSVVLSKYQIGDGTYTSFNANTTYLVRVAAVYDNGDSRAFSNESGDPVTTADYATPTNVRGSNPTPSTIQLAWDFSDPIGLPEKFAIEYSKNGGATWPYREGAGATLTGKPIDGLEPDQSYVFRVTSEYASGETRRSQVSDPISTAKLPLKLTNVVVDGKHEATIHWQALAAIPHALFIEVRSVDGSGNPLEGWFVPTGGNIVTDMTRTSKQITELLPGTSYEVRLVSTNAAGNRTESVSGSLVTEAYPRITDLESDSPTKQGAMVRWTRLETLDGDANVTRNVVEIFKNGVLVASPETGSGSGTKHSLQLTGLEAGTNYEFRVVAYNGNVKLSDSERSEFSTLIDGLSVDQVTQTSARANWTQFAGGGATDYRVKVLLPGTNTVVRQKIVSIGSGFRQTTMDGLSAQTNYEMLVEVLKNSTVLSYSNRATFRTADAATAPTNVQLSKNKWRALNVTWSPPSNWVPSNYTVRVYTTSGQLVRQTNSSSTATEVTDLAVGTAYYATVTANGSQGSITSQQSAAVSTYGLEAPTNFAVSQSGSLLTFSFNHFIPNGLISSGFSYRIERLGTQGNWQTVKVKSGSQLTSGTTSQSFGVNRTGSDASLNTNETYKFRVVAVYTNNERLSNEFSHRVT
jgi:hypothetical protein